MNARNALASLGALGLSLLFLSSPAAAAKDAQNKPVLAHGFRVEIDGVDAGQFTAVDGLSVEQEVIEFQDGNDPLTRKRPGRVKYANITLTRRLSSDTALWDWMQESIQQHGGVKRRVVKIVVLSKLGDPIHTWILYEGWPVKWYVPDMDSDQSGMAIEKIEIAVEKVERA